MCFEAIDVGRRAKVNGGSERTPALTAAMGAIRAIKRVSRAGSAVSASNARASERGERGKGRAVIDKVAELDEF